MSARYARYGPLGALRRQRGLAMVEFAISAPVILLLMFGTFEFGRLMTEYSALNDGVRNAARYMAGKALSGSGGGMVTGTQWSTLVTEGTNLAVFGNIGGTPPAILPGLIGTNITMSEDTAAGTITVAADYPYTSLFGGSAIPTFFMGGSLSTAYRLKISTTMKAL